MAGLLFLVTGSYIAISVFLSSKTTAPKAVLSVNAPYVDSGVYLNDKYIGPTPLFKDDVDPGEVTLRVGNFTQKITLTGGALTAVNQDLGPGKFSGGEVIWFTKENNETAMTVISNPIGVDVILDGNKIGITPFRSSQLTAAEHTLVLSKSGYVTREIKIILQNNYLLNVSANLMKRPLPESVTILPTTNTKLKLLNYSSQDPELLSNPEQWLKACAFYFQSIGVADSDKPDYYLDAKGTLFSNDGEVVSLENYPTSGRSLTLGYLGPKTIGVVPQSVIDSLAHLSAKTGDSEVQLVQILPTGLGYLNAHSESNQTSGEVRKLMVGEQFELQEETGGWLRLKFIDGGEGWIPSQFAKKL